MGGRHIKAQVGEKIITLVTVGEVAAALGRTPRTIIGWEHTGLIPPAPFRTSSGDEHLRRRLWPVELVKALQRVAEQEGFGKRRSSEFRRHQALLHEAWQTAMGSVLPDEAADADPE